MQAARKYDYESATVRPQRPAFASEGKASTAVGKHKRISYGHKSTMFRAVFLTAILLIATIGFTAYGVQIKYSINETNTEIASVQSQIDNLNLEISQQMSPSTIEAKALEIGMVRPTRNQQVYLEGTGAPNVAIAKAND